MSRNKPNRQAPVAPASYVREGEGFPVQITFGPPTTQYGLAARSFAFDLSKAPVPERKYHAETCSVELPFQSVRILFGQKEIGSSRLRNLLIVTMSVQGAAAFVQSIDAMRDPSAVQLAEIPGFSPEISEPVTEEPRQAVVPLVASFAIGGMIGYNACMDFYEASPFSMSFASTTNRLYVDPTVRVNLRTPLFLGLVQELRAHTSSVVVQPGT